MTEFANESIGSFDDKTHEYVHVWYDETMVTNFWFHSVGVGAVLGAYHRVFGVGVEARHIFAACKAFSGSPDWAVGSDGQKRFVTHVWIKSGDIEEFRLGGKYGKPIARMIRTGYVQQERRA